MLSIFRRSNRRAWLAGYFAMESGETPQLRTTAGISVFQEFIGASSKLHFGSLTSGPIEQTIIRPRRRVVGCLRRAPLIRHLDSPGTRRPLTNRSGRFFFARSSAQSVGGPNRL